MASQKLRYKDFWDSINVDAVEEALGWVPEYTHNDNDVGFCMFPDNHSHGDTTGKFAIHREKRVYNCWACGGGDFLSLAMEKLDLDPEEALSWLYQFTEADMRSDSQFVDDFMDAFRDVERRVETLPYFNERVLDKYDEDIPSLYLEARGITVDVAAQYNMRYSANVRRPAPQRGKFADEPDYEGPGIIFPHYWKGRLVGWQTRWLDDDRPEWIPKYTNTTDFPKESTIYGMDQVVRNPMTIVVESAPSVIFLASEGYSAVGTFGSNVNEAQQRILRRFPEVVLSADGGQAGQKWLRDNTAYLKNYSRVWHLPTLDEDYDIGDFSKLDSSRLKAYLGEMYEPGIDL